MVQLITWPVAGALAVAGIAIGSYLGNEATTFAEKGGGGESFSYASLSPNPGSRVADLYAERANPPGDHDYGTGCTGCSLGGTRNYVVEADLEPAFPDGYEPASLGAREGYREPVAVVEEELEADLAQIRRYTDYAVDRVERALDQPVHPAQDFNPPVPNLPS